MYMTRREARSTWQRHGFLFSALFGACIVALLIGGLRLAGIDVDSTAYDHPWWVSALFLIGIALAVVPSYYLALAVSDACYFLRQRLWRALGLGA